MGVTINGNSSDWSFKNNTISPLLIKDGQPNQNTRTKVKQVIVVTLGGYVGPISCVGDKTVVLFKKNDESEYTVWLSQYMDPYKEIVLLTRQSGITVRMPSNMYYSGYEEITLKPYVPIKVMYLGNYDWRFLSSGVWGSY